MASGNLLNNVSATGAGAWVMWGGGSGNFEVDGTLGGSTVSLQVLDNSGNAVSVGPDTDMTVAGIKAFGPLRPGQIRANIIGGSPSGVYASAWRTRSP